MLRQDVDDLAIAALVGIFDDAGNGRKERVVAADADIAAGKNLGATLADDDRAGKDGFATVCLDTASLTVRVAAVL